MKEQRIYAGYDLNGTALNPMPQAGSFWHRLPMRLTREKAI